MPPPSILHPRFHIAASLSPPPHSLPREVLLESESKPRLLHNLPLHPHSLSTPNKSLRLPTQNNSLRTLKRISRFQNLPRTHGTRFYAQHILIPLLWLKVRHTLRFFNPGVPDDDIGQVIAEDSKLGLVVRQDGDGHGGGRVAGGGVDAVGFGGDG